jgi:pSer/pThr/pTyr-binding forkhead associated (FHA) protein
MWKLTIEDDEGKQTQLPLAHEEYGIGRAESNSIRLTDRNVSRNHATLRKNGQGWILKDLQSYNGTYVNGVRVIGEQPINAGDIVQLGDYRLELADETALAAAAAQGAAAAPAVPPVHQRPNRLVVVIGPQPGTEFPLDKEHFTMGRSEDVDISINHSSVSRVHAELFALGNGRFEIVDKASANGIRINGVELKRGILEAGDALELGDVRLRFVGAGKIFRADMTQQLPAVAGFATSVGPAGKSGMTVGKMIGIGAAIVLVAGIAAAAVISRSGPPPAVGATKHVVNKENAKQLEEALKLLDQKDIEGAHKRLLEIPEDVRPTDDPGFKKIESAWADKKFAEVDAVSDSKAKKAILKEIASTDTVDAKTRTKAAEMIRDIEAKEPPPPPDPVQRPAGGFNPGSSGAPAPTAEPAKTVVAPLPAQGPPNEEQMRRSLEPKVWGGRASVDEIRMLKAICSHMGDHACRNRAAEMLRKKQEGN